MIDMASDSTFFIVRPGCRLAASVHLPAVVPAPAVVCCHGLLSSKESEKFIAIAEELSKKGFVALRFDFSGCGRSDAPPEHSLLDARMSDLLAVLDYVRDQVWAKGRISLLGSSLGGYLALQAAAFEGEDKIGSVVCWATPYSLGRVRRAIEESDPAERALPEGMILGDPDELAGLPAVPRVLIIHGQEDELVPWEQATTLYRKAGEPRRLILLDTADHRILDPAWRRLAIRESVEWFVQHEGKGEVA